jgi:hypothetical protein
MVLTCRVLVYNSINPAASAASAASDIPQCACRTVGASEVFPGNFNTSSQPEQVQRQRQGYAVVNEGHETYFIEEA